MIVNFWASWCVPCRTEFPLLHAARADHAAEGLEVLGIVFKDTADAARAFMRQQDATWPMLLDPGGSAATAYGIQVVPVSFYLDRNGVVRAVSFGPPPSADLAGLLAPILAPAVSQPAGSASPSASGSGLP